jgi:hypothetical protein
MGTQVRRAQNRAAQSGFLCQHGSWEIYVNLAKAAIPVLIAVLICR